jgi:ubiquinone/menaquinone biosynthesis C-methylase UbiE
MFHKTTFELLLLGSTAGGSWGLVSNSIAVDTRKGRNGVHRKAGISTPLVCFAYEKDSISMIDKVLSISEGPSTTTTSRRNILLSGPIRSIIAGTLSLYAYRDNAAALTPIQASSSYDKYAAKYDELDGGSIASSLGLDDARQSLIGSPFVHGKVLEVGAGTGLNMNKYSTENDNRIQSITFLDISEGMLREAKEKSLLVFPIAGPRQFDVEFIQGDATSDLEKVFGPQSLDTVIDTFSLCVLGNDGASRCLEQMKNIVKPKSEGGELSGADLSIFFRFLYLFLKRTKSQRFSKLFILYGCRSYIIAGEHQSDQSTTWLVPRCHC